MGTNVISLSPSTLAAAWLNRQETPNNEQEIFGCYTIGDNWTFIRGMVSDFEADYPLMVVEFSPEYFQRLEATTILKILKFIVAKHQKEV